MNLFLSSVFLTAFVVLLLQGAARQSVPLPVLGMLMAAIAVHFS